MKKTLWSDAAKAGGIIGLVLFVISLLDGVFELNGAKGAVSIIYFIALTVMIYYFAKRRSAKARSVDGFAYGQSVGYIFAMMLFAGIVVGLGNVLLHTAIAPEYYDAQLQLALTQNPMINLDSELMQQSMELTGTLMKNPIVILLSGIANTVIYGGLIGLIVSILTKKNPDVFAENN